MFQNEWSAGIGILEAALEEAASAMHAGGAGAFIKAAGMNEMISIKSKRKRP